MSVTITATIIKILLLFIIIEFFTSKLWLRNIQLSWDVVMNSVRLGGLICSYYCYYYYYFASLLKSVINYGFAKKSAG